MIWETPALPARSGWHGSGRKVGRTDLRQSAILPDFQGLPSLEMIAGDSEGRALAWRKTHLQKRSRRTGADAIWSGAGTAH